MQVIEDRAFCACPSIRSFCVPKSVRTIKKEAFCGCKQLSNVTFEEGSQLASVESNAFSGCTALKQIALPADAKVEPDALPDFSDGQPKAPNSEALKI